MDTNQKKAENNATGSPAQATPAGLDLNGLTGGGGGELIKYLLSTGGAVLINYLMSIKPLQDKMEALTSKVTEQGNQIEALEARYDELVNQLNKKFKKKEPEPADFQESSGEYFPIKKDKYLSGRKQRKFDV